MSALRSKADGSAVRTEGLVRRFEGNIAVVFAVTGIQSGCFPLRVSCGDLSAAGGADRLAARWLQGCGGFARDRRGHLEPEEGGPHQDARPDCRPSTASRPGCQLAPLRRGTTIVPGATEL